MNVDKLIEDLLAGLDTVSTGLDQISAALTEFQDSGPEPPIEPPIEPPVGGDTYNLQARPYYGYVELSWTPQPGMFQITRDGQPLDSVPFCYYLDFTVTGGQQYTYAVAPKTLGQANGTPSKTVSVTATTALPPEKSMAELNAAIAQGTADMPAGIYRIPKDNQEPDFSKSMTYKSSNRDCWILCSRNWATGGEAGNSWTKVGSYWRSSRQAPVLNANDQDHMKISDETLTSFYNNVTVWTDKAVQTWLRPLAPGATPSGAQVCFESGSDRRLRIGVDPALYQRIEVSEALNWRSHAPASNTVFEGLTFRGSGGGSQNPCFEVMQAKNVTFRSCVFGNTHSGALSYYNGETDTNCQMLVERCLFDHCGYQCLSVTGIRGLTVRDTTFAYTGGQGYNETWHGGDIKFVGNPKDLLFEYCRSHFTTGATFWADISAGPYEIHHCKVAHSNRFYGFSHEISIQGNVHHNLFWDGGRGTGYPTAHTDQGNTLNFHDNVVVGADGSAGDNDGKVWQFQGGTGPNSFRGDLPPGGVHDNSITNNVFIHVSSKAGFAWSKESQGKFRYDGNRWWSANPNWHFHNYSEWITSINDWNNIPDVGQDIFMSTEEKDAVLRLWGIIP